MFGAEDDDTDFLSPTGGAKLASLFGLDQSENRQGNESFQYTAPKQPKKGPAGPKPPKPSGPPAAAGPAPTVLFATAVHAYKFVTGQYVKQGKFGAAVLGNHAAKEYRILLYISQQQPVTSTRIHPGFVFTVQQNNYATFYDDQRQNWSVMFESEAAAVDFSKQVCIARCNSSPCLEGVLCQDLLLGDGPAADAGDLLEVAYTGWLFQNQALGQVFDSNVQKDKMLRLKLGSGKVIKGWEEGMLGMKKGGRRLLIIPPALGYGAQGLAGRIPPNSTLVFEVEVKRMKAKDLGSDRQSVGSRDSPVSLTDSLPQESLPQPPTSVPPQPGEPAVRAKSNSISEQLANPDMAKAKLISRMAKMGQPMLPFLAGSSTPQPDSSDSEMEDPNIQRLSPHPTTTGAPLLVRPTPQTNHTPVASHMQAPVPQAQPPQGFHAPSAALLPVAPLTSQAFPPGTAAAFQPYAGIQYSAPTAQLQPIGSMYPPQIQQPAHFQASGDVTTFLMTEARQHSTEIRMSISKIADKIDTLASKVDNLQKENSAGASHLIPGISSITMESTMIMNNIQRIVQENERLKQEVLDKSSRIEEQNAKIGDLITRNQRYVEQSNLLMEQRNDSLQTTAETTQAKVLHAMKEKAKLAEELAAATNQVSRLQVEVTTSQKKEMELRTQLEAALQDVEKHKAQLSALQVHLIEVQETSEQTKSRAKTEKDGRRQLEVSLAAREEEVADLKAEKENLLKSLAERKRRSQQERQRAEEEQEEMRRAFHEELEDLKQVLKKTREQAAAGQRSSARDLDEQRLAELEVQAAELQPLRQKCADLRSQLAALTEEYRRTRPKVEESGPARDTTEEVKKIMNGVFQSLRTEFDLEETYSGRAVLGTIMSTIKMTTLQLLKKPQAEGPVGSSSEEEEEEEETTAAQSTTQSTKQLETEEQPVSVASSDDPQDMNEEPAQRLEEETSGTRSERHETADGRDEGNHLDARVDEESSVEVFQEVTGTSSALVHMISSDMPESGAVLCAERESRGETSDGDKANASESPTRLSDEINSITGREEPPASIISTAEAEDGEERRQDVPPPSGSNEDGSRPVPPTHQTINSSTIPSEKEEDVSGQTQSQQLHVGADDSDDEDLFKIASPRPQNARREEEEEEEEVSFKGCPPPAPLFGDDDDDEDNDLDWLG